LDALRALAIMLVIVAHYPKPEGGLAMRVLNFGWVGVDLFFVLSGYLIAGQLFAAVAGGREVSLSAFYIRRFLRTLPNYYVVLAVYGLLPMLLSAIPATPLGKYTIFAQNFGVPAVFSPSWSLCVEEQFYLLFPIVVVLLTRSRWAGLGVSIAAGILIVEIAIRSSIWLTWRPDLLPSTQAVDVYMGHLYFPTYCRLDGITLGIGIAALGCGMGQGKLAASAMESIGRNPNSTNQLFVPMIIGLAFVESLTLYSLVISFILQGKI